MSTNEPRITIDTIAPHAVKVTVEHQAFGVYEYHQHDLEGARAELMDGGVTAAAIEKDVDGYTAEDFARAEFARHPRSGRIAARLRSGKMWAWTAGRDEERLRDDQMGGWVPVHECPDPDAHWRIVEAFERAEKAEKERDDLRAQLEADSDVNYLLREDRDAWKRKAEQPRPVTPEVTDEMVERGWASISPTLREALSRHTIRRILETALTEPTRPHGAEELETVIGLNAGKWTTGAEDVRALADLLASHGVRVVTEEQP